MDFNQIPLRDIHAPEAIGWWPLAPGWWVLMLLVLILLLLLAKVIRRKLKDPRRAALQELRSIEQNYSEHQNNQQLLIDCNSLLKRLALTLYPRAQVAPLSGKEWLDFLCASVETFNRDELEVLIQGPYQPNPELDGNALLKNCRQCLQRMRGGDDV